MTYDARGARRVTEHDDAPAWGFADIAVCQRCSKDVVLDHDPPCPHGYVGCPECGHEAVCLECARAEAGDLRATIRDLTATVRRLETLRDHWRETGTYGSPGYVRKQYHELARTLTKTLEGERGSE